MSIRWHSINRSGINFIPASLLTCLRETGSLTKHLEQFCIGELQLELISQSWKRPLQNEANKLELRNGEYALVREIYFKCKSVPWVYARSIIPRNTLRGAQRRLAYLGTRSLGSYLFSERTTFRGNMEIAIIPKQDKLSDLALHNASDKNEHLWGRRSVFYIKDKPLLVVEIFLPDVIKCIDTGNR